MTALTTWAGSLPEVKRLELFVEPGNEGSWRVAEARGYQREGLLRSWQLVGAERRDMYVYSVITDRVPATWSVRLEAQVSVLERSVDAGRGVVGCCTSLLY